MRLLASKNAVLFTLRLTSSSFRVAWCFQPTCVWNGCAHSVQAKECGESEKGVEQTSAAQAMRVFLYARVQSTQAPFLNIDHSALLTALKMHRAGQVAQLTKNLAPLQVWWLQHTH